MKISSSRMASIGGSLGRAGVSYALAVFAAQCLITLIQWRMTGPFFEFTALIAVVHLPLFFALFLTTALVFSRWQAWALYGLNILIGLAYAALYLTQFKKFGWDSYMLEAGWINFLASVVLGTVFTVSFRNLKSTWPRKA